MPKKSETSKVNYGELSKTILGLVAAAGIISIFILMPGLAKAVPVFSKHPPAKKKKQLRKALSRLEKRGLIKVWIDNKGKEQIKATSKGHEEFVRYQLKNKQIKKPKRWDKKWRVVMFDVPERYRSSRDYFRSSIKLAGFVQLQRSAWVYPYPCNEIIELMSSIHRMNAGMIYLTCNRFPGDKKFVNKFKLK
ncbi:hypothetical protein KJ937_01595 [Patescibacteria group bacterium]|nr:hypothetical protein [Patescibacteria group bacterium]MBU2509182.1 hypothetical protein [Patescibacteria group bacterium]